MYRPKHIRVLIVEDEWLAGEQIKSVAETSGYEPVGIATSGEEALEMTAALRPDVVLMDVNMPGMGGLEATRRIQERCPTPVVVLTAYQTGDLLQEAGKAGIGAYLVKPLNAGDMVRAVSVAIARFHDMQELRRMNEQLQAEIDARRQAEQERDRLEHLAIALKGGMHRFGDLVGKSDSMQALYDAITKASDVDEHVLISGETGTGKELVARTIHTMSARRDGPFIPVNSGAIPENLFEREMFGHRKGAFTGAHENQSGFFQAANHGTLFLDELGELNPAMQVKLLRALEGSGYTPLGGQALQTPDLRIVAATNRDLRQQVLEGTMRRDFFYRIHIISLKVPPLRERKEDIPLLAEHFLRQFGSELHEFPSGILDHLCSYDWPGNIRELQNVLRRYLSLGRLDFGEDFSPKAAQSQDDIFTHMQDNQSLPELVEQFERQYILNMLAQNQWNKTRTAEIIGLPRRTFHRKLEKLGIK